MKILTTGTFDVLHYGHIKLLERAKSLGDYLVVGLNVTKNGQQTYYSYEERKLILQALKYVDEVVPIYKQEDKYKYLKEVDLFVIGSDYIGYEDIEKIKKYCDVRFIERTPNISSTQVKKYLSDKTYYDRFVIDLDDTICYTTNRDFENSVPNTEVIQKINKLYDNGWEIIIFTARGDKSCKTLAEKEFKYRDITERWLKKNNVKYTKLMFGKPNSDYYVDDKNISIEEFINKEFGSCEV